MKKFYFILFLSILLFCSSINFSFAFNWNDGSIVNYYDFNEVSGTNINDKIAQNNFSLQNSDGDEWQTGILGNAYELDGVNDYANNSDSWGNVNGKNFSLSFWIKANDLVTPYQGAISKRTVLIKGFTFTNDIYLNHFSWYFGGDSNFNFSTTATNTDWHYYTITKNNSNMSLFLDSSLVNWTIVGTDTTDNINSVIGRIYTDTDSFYYNGRIDELGLWNRSLSQSEISELYNGGSGLPYSFSPINITLTFPQNYVNLTNGNSYFNASYNSTLSGFSLTNATYYLWFSNGTAYNITHTKSLSGLNNATSEFFVIPLGNYVWNVRGCMGNGVSLNCSFSPNNYSFSFTPFNINQESYTTNVIEGTTQTFWINVTLSSGFLFSSAILNHNGTNYTATITNLGGNNYNISKAIIIPSVTTLSNMSFIWYVLINNSQVYNTTLKNQTVSNIGIDDCSTFTQKLLNYTLRDEQTQEILNGSVVNGSIEVSVNIFPIGLSTPIITFSKIYTNATNALVCINGSFIGADYKMDSIAKYYATDYQTEYNIISQASLNSSNLHQNITLLDLPSSVSTIFTISYKGATFNPVQNAVIDMSRLYVSENTFKTIERPITDIDGKTTASLIKDTGIYNFYVYLNGSLVATYLNVIPVCQTPVVSECKIDLNSFSSSIPVTDFSTSQDFLFTLTNNRTSRTTTATFTIPSGSVSTIVLNVSTSDALGTNVCSQTTTTSAGSLSCTYSETLGNATLTAKFYKNGILVGQGQVSLEQTPQQIYGGILIILGIFIMLTLIGASMSNNPVLTVLFFLVGVILLFSLNLVAHNGFIGAGATILFLVIGIILIIIKGAKR